ncbi:hypothetical protein ACHAXS_002337 [Conticribra weissflogii]
MHPLFMRSLSHFSFISRTSPRSGSYMEDGNVLKLKCQKVRRAGGCHREQQQQKSSQRHLGHFKHTFITSTMTMKTILSLGLAAMATMASADTQIAVIEFSPSGKQTVHRTTTPSNTSTPAGVASFWNVMHRRTKRSVQHAGMSVVPDMFHKADAGIVIGIRGNGADLAVMPTAGALLGGSSDDVVGTIRVAGQVGRDLLSRASKGIESISDTKAYGAALSSTAEKAARGLEGLEAVSLDVESGAAAAEADAQLGRMIEALKKQAAENGKSVVVHLVVEEEEGAARRKLQVDSDVVDSSEGETSRRRLQEDEANGENQNNNNNNGNGQSYAYGYKSMVEIQNFNVIAWTALGLVALVFMVLSYFASMPLMPDTLLFGETAKMMSD